ncbi:MAG: LamG domain-containing protein [Phycisphaerales bacterium]|nr:MAG: LamG domain-containing protein [Phycisphaerales bacterium]
MRRKVICLISLVLALNMTGNTSADLVVHWGFDETSGSVVHDASGNGHDGTINGTADWVPGQVGGALHFDGSTYVDVPDEIGTFPTFSIALWFKYDSFIPDWNSIWHNDGWQTAWLHHMVTNYAGQDIRVQFALNGLSPGNDQFGITPIETDVWYHSTVTYDSIAGQMNFYLTTDAERKVNLDVALTVSGPAIIITAGQIGGWEGNRLSSATFDDIRMYDHILSEAEILSAMQGKPWPFAFGPSPEDGSTLEATWVNMSWQPGQLAVSHDVYMGDNFDDVNDGLGDTFRGNQGATNYIVGFPGYAFPDGLVPGTTYYWRVDEVNDADPNSPWKGDVWSFWVPPKKAYEPSPSDGAPFVDTNVVLGWTPGFGARLHYVYFGDNADDVANAAEALPQPEATFAPGTLEREKTYYWRVDESDGITTHKGDVWTFTTLPDIPVTDPDLVAWLMFDEGSGNTALDLSGHDHHGTLMGDPQRVVGYDGGALEFGGRDDYVSLAAPATLDFGTNFTWSAWIRTSSDGTVIARAPASGNWAQGGKSLFVRGGLLTVDVGWVGFVESTFAVDDGQWHHVAATTEFETGATDEDTTTLYIDGVPAGGRSDWNVNAFDESSHAVKIGFTNGNFPARPWFKGQIDDLRVYSKVLTPEELQLVMRIDPLRAWQPRPANGSVPDIDGATPLSWSPGDNASSHEVYFGTDADAVKNADTSDTTGIHRGRQNGTSFTPAEGVEWGTGPFYWRVDENNSDGTVTTGSIWTFSVADYLIVDDIESYNDLAEDDPASNRIYLAWIDGFGTATNGAVVGNLEVPLTERANVHGGLQAMPYSYDNNLKTSEATLTLAKRDWTSQGVTKLSLWFRGDTANAAERMFVALNGNAVVYHDDASVTQITGWTEWVIDLTAFGIDLTNVNTITIGFGTKNSPAAGGTGRMYFDDIRLVR